MQLDYFTLTKSDKLPELDFTEGDGSDPMNINSFYRSDLQLYSSNNLSKVWLAKNKSQIVAYFTVSMSAIELDKLSINEKVRGTTPTRYPAMLIGRMGVAKPYRNNGVGLQICDFCRGLAIDIGQRIACRYLVLQTTDDKIQFYKKSGFEKSNVKPRKGLYWMYSRII